jgi:hypothetical protein
MTRMCPLHLTLSSLLTVSCNITSLATPLSILYPANVIAAAALYVACQQIGERRLLESFSKKSPEDVSNDQDKESGEEDEPTWDGFWYELFQAPFESIRGDHSSATLSHLLRSLR